MNKSMDKLHLDSERGWFGGVCAGLAKFFDVEPFIVRIITVVATLTWSLTILVYIVLYFVMSKKSPSLDNISEQFSSSKLGKSGIAKHFKNVDYKKRIYKSYDDKKISGVCAGLANYFETSPFFIRLACVLSLFFGPFAIFAYIVAAIIMDREPYPDADGYSKKDYDNYQDAYDEATYHAKKNAFEDELNGNNTSSRRKARHQERNRYSPNSRSNSRKFSRGRVDKRDISDCDKTFSSLESKLQKLEATITSKKFRLHNEIKRMEANT